MPGDDHVALLAEHDGLVVGVASYEVLSGDRAEMAILVDDAWQGDGIGSLLIEHLTAVARRDGIQELVGDVLATNVSMLRTTASLAPGIARQHGEDPERCSHPDPHTARRASACRSRCSRPHGRTQFPTPPASTCLAGRHRCQPCSERRWVRGPPAPSSPADSPGRTYPVNPHAKTIDGLACYPSIGAIPGTVDLAIIAVPAVRALRGRRGVRGCSRGRGRGAQRRVRRDRTIRCGDANHRFWPRPAGTTSGLWGRTALG